jgi:hypothetical protein
MFSLAGPGAAFLFDMITPVVDPPGHCLYKYR